MLGASVPIAAQSASLVGAPFVAPPRMTMPGPLLAAEAIAASCSRSTAEYGT